MPNELSGFVCGRGAGGRNAAEVETAERVTAMVRTFPRVTRPIGDSLFVSKIPHADLVVSMTPGSD